MKDQNQEIKNSIQQLLAIWEAGGQEACEAFLAAGQEAMMEVINKEIETWK